MSASCSAQTGCFKLHLKHDNWELIGFWTLSIVWKSKITTLRKLDLLPSSGAGERLHSWVLHWTFCWVQQHMYTDYPQICKCVLQTQTLTYDSWQTHCHQRHWQTGSSVQNRDWCVVRSSRARHQDWPTGCVSFASWMRLPVALIFKLSVS
jgi:hypothetical protein